MEFTSEVAPRVAFETLRMTWPSESKHVKDEARPTVILKPPGQVAELSKNGYALKAELKWDIKLYNEVQVCILSFSASKWIFTNHIRSLSGTRQNLVSACSCLMRSKFRPRSTQFVSLYVLFLIRALYCTEDFWIRRVLRSLTFSITTKTAGRHGTC